MEKKNYPMGAVRWLILFLLIWPFSGYAYEGTEVSDGGTIRGAVRFQGEIPELASLQVSKYKQLCEDVPDETLIIGLDFGVQNSVVTLEGISKGEKVERDLVHELDNQGCRFIPHVQAASVGQWLLIRNSDPILHAAHAFFQDGQPDFNVGLSPGKIRKKPLVSPGIIRIICEVHPWMSAYIVVTDHPYHTVSDLFGEFEIRNVPPGTYRLKVWQERLGSQVKEVVVKRKAVIEVNFLFRPNKGGEK